MKTLGVVVRMALGLIFLAASWDKIVDPVAFAKILRNYQILPDMLINGAAMVLPWIEVVVGMCLLTGFVAPGAGLVSCLLMAVFLSAMAYAQYKGISTQCGCFTTKADDTISTATFIRDGSIMTLALLVTVDGFIRARRA